MAPSARAVEGAQGWACRRAAGHTHPPSRRCHGGRCPRSAGSRTGRAAIRAGVPTDAARASTAPAGGSRGWRRIHGCSTCSGAHAATGRSIARCRVNRRGFETGGARHSGAARPDTCRTRAAAGRAPTMCDGGARAVLRTGLRPPASAVHGHAAQFTASVTSTVAVARFVCGSTVTILPAGNTRWAVTFLRKSSMRVRSKTPPAGMGQERSRRPASLRRETGRRQHAHVERHAFAHDHPIAHRMLPRRRMTAFRPSSSRGTPRGRRPVRTALSPASRRPPSAISPVFMLSALSSTVDVSALAPDHSAPSHVYAMPSDSGTATLTPPRQSGAQTPSSRDD